MRNRNKPKSIQRRILSGMMFKKTRIDAYIQTNLWFLGNPSFSIYLDWRDKNNTSTDPHGEYYIYVLSKRRIGDKWFNMDKVEAEIQSTINLIKDKHPNVHIIGQKDCLQIIRQHFDGLYYRTKDIESYKSNGKVQFLLDN